jgi:uncharacterized protein RhaS with RHS repeats
MQTADASEVMDSETALVYAEPPAPEVGAYEYDAQGREIAYRDTNGDSWRKEYAPDGSSVLRFTGADGETHEDRYDADGVLIAA